ncbi:hypothetical protein PCL_07143 [Purpureocillium lilacinum]|uniref:Uncharacterized protein n=1 Tax=Purpureocillium lilacinum TaxID=33203 RepID=A0A2U3DT06_PURLI|nr:hypothetical protein PCL_07143 [Purpureocillium lilacinum]
MSYTDFDHLPLGRRGGAAGHVTSARPAAAAGGPPAWPGLPFLPVQSDDDGAPPNTRLFLPANSDSTVPLPSTDAGAMAQGRFGGEGSWCTYVCPPFPGMEGAQKVRARRTTPPVCVLAAHRGRTAAVGGSMALASFFFSLALFLSRPFPFGPLLVASPLRNQGQQRRTGAALGRRRRGGHATCGRGWWWCREARAGTGKGKKGSRTKRAFSAPAFAIGARKVFVEIEERTFGHNLAWKDPFVLEVTALRPPLLAVALNSQCAGPYMDAIGTELSIETTRAQDRAGRVRGARVAARPGVGCPPTALPIRVGTGRH